MYSKCTVVPVTIAPMTVVCPEGVDGKHAIRRPILYLNADGTEGKKAGLFCVSIIMMIIVTDRILVCA